MGYTYLVGLLDVLFPKKCVVCKKMGEYLCASCFSQISFDIPSKCLMCEKPSLDGLTHPKCQGKYTIDGYIAAVCYKRVMKKLLYQFKYQPYLSDLQTVFTDLLYENLIQSEQFDHMVKTGPLLVPIPLSKGKLRKRGYNQAELLAKGLGKRFGLPMQNLLKRAKETKPQYGLSREERIENMKGAFEINRAVIANKVVSLKKLALLKEKPSYKRVGIASSFATPRNDVRTVLLVDDVLTTGSTLKEAARVLKKNGFEKVWGIVLAQD